MVESEPSQHDFQPKSTVSVKSQTGNKVITVTYDLKTATVGDVRKSAAKQLSIKSGSQTQLMIGLKDDTLFRTFLNKPNEFQLVVKESSKQSSASASAKKTPKKPKTPTLSPRKRKSSPGKSPGK
jgi:hypothetical protein